MSFAKDVFRSDARVVKFLSALTLSGIAYGLYRGIQDNYLAEIVYISAFERGIVEFFREMPGLLVVLFLALMYRFSDNRIFKIGSAFIALGLVGFVIGSYCFPGSKFSVILFMVIYSTGEHINMPVRTSITLDLSNRNQAGTALGIIGAIGQVGHIVGFVLVMGLFFLFSRLGYSRTDIFQFRIVFISSTILMIAAVLTAMTMKDSAEPGLAGESESITRIQRRRFYFHKKFYKYYMLEVFYGSRKQIFLTFAPYVLILQYGADASVISLLMGICAVFGFLLNPMIGKIIDRLGYKFVMVTDTLILIVVCLLYGFAHRVFPPKIAFLVVCTNYVLDSIISMASMASNVYVQRISSSQEEITATLSTGISVNHLISIFIALMGGWIWKVTGIEVLFSLSAFLGLLNSIYAATINEKKEEVKVQIP